MTKGALKPTGNTKLSSEQLRHLRDDDDDEDMCVLRLLILSLRNLVVVDVDDEILQRSLLAYMENQLSMRFGLYVEAEEDA